MLSCKRMNNKGGGKKRRGGGKEGEERGGGERGKFTYITFHIALTRCRVTLSYEKTYLCFAR